MNSIPTSHYLHPTSLTFNESGFYLLCQCWKGSFFSLSLQCLALLKNKTKERVFSFGLQFIITTGFYSFEFVIAEKRKILIKCPLVKCLFENFPSNHLILNAKKKKKMYFSPMKARQVMS